MKLKIVTELPKADLPDGFYYVGQDNYYVANLNNPNTTFPEKYLYSDSATSCIIIIVEGKDKNNNPIVALSHLSRTDRFNAFFNLVDGLFLGTASVFAQGANPPSADASKTNTGTVLKWLNSHVPPPSGGTPASMAWYLDQATLSLGLGNPQEADRGDYGIDLSNMIVTNQSFTLTDAQRDPTLGVQTLFCVFGLKVDPPLVLHHSTDSFAKADIDRLVAAANADNWTDILYMTKDEVLNKYSSTPEYEAPWFYATLRESALYVKNYKS